MRLNLPQLAAHLKRPLAPVYLVAGDEPLQQGEALDALRAAALAQGYSLREVLDGGTDFDWRQLAAASANLSLFGDQRLLELRLPTNKVGLEGSQALVTYCSRPPPDTLLLLVCPKLDKGQAESKWVRTITEMGVFLPIWPVEPQQLPGWVAARLRARGIEPGAGVAEWLALRVEGNLLAAAQEVEKLLLLRGPGRLEVEALEASVADSARYSVFDLADAALAGNAARGLRILDLLRGEGAAEPLVLWALIREIRLVAGLVEESRSGRPPAQVVGGRRDIWEKRRPLYLGALQRRPRPDYLALLGLCALADRTVKGLHPGDPWPLLEDITLGLCGLTPVLHTGLPSGRA